MPVIGPRAPRLAVPLALGVLLAGCGPPPVSAGTQPPAPVSPAPAPSAPAGRGCPEEGVRVEVGQGDAASGLRVLGLSLVNCGSRAYRVKGYPGLRALGADRNALGVRVLHGAATIAGSGLPGDGPPGPVVLEPGERAGATLAWRNTYDDLREPPVTVRFLEVAPVAGRPVQVVEPEHGLDLGSTGRIAVSAWSPRPAG
ncbi:hypothetical protein Asp14428_10530 [Actinoplanes sp. NBRC 14428]|nr:hypothetical protein Asp14428_10530 [Actinoplanes sp. NBRC 14428]